MNDAAVISAFKDKTKEMFHELGGMDAETIENFVKGHVQELITEYGLDVKIKDVVVSGSRSRGIETDGSDLDVVLYFSGTEREDALFNLLHEDGIILGGVSLDINPISQEQTGSLSEYLTGVETYLTEKQARMQREAEQANVADAERMPETLVTYTVAECGEFHGHGEYHENIATIEETKALFEAIPPDRINGIPAIGINVHKEAKGAEDIQWDFLYGNMIDLDMLNRLPDMMDNPEAIKKIGQLIEAFPEAEIIGTLPVYEAEKRQDAELAADMDAVKPVYVDEAAKLAAEIDRFSKDFDPYEYQDSVDNWEIQVQNIADDIRNGNSKDYKKYLGDIIDQSDNIEDVRKAAELLVKLAEYKPLAKVEELEEENLNQIDNYLSNTVPKAEERKNIRNEEQERIEEEERKRRRSSGKRQSLRARLAEKKTIVAAGSQSPQTEKQRQAQRDAVAAHRDI